MPLTDPALWAEINARPLPFRAERDELASPPRTCTCFAPTLRKAGDWTDESAELLEREYRRFAYLAAIAARPVVPPPLTGEVIDLLTALGDRSAVPVAPGVASADGGTVPYATILDVYVREFGWWPPRAIWPSDQDVAWGRMCNGLFWVGMVGFLVMGVLGAFNKVVLRLISDLIGGTTETEQIMRELLAGDLNAGWIETAYVVVIFGFWLLSLVAVLSKPPMLSKSQSQ